MVMLCTKLDPAKLQLTAPNSPATSGCGPEVLPLPLAEEITSILHPKSPAWVQEGVPRFTSLAHPLISQSLNPLAV